MRSRAWAPALRTSLATRMSCCCARVSADAWRPAGRGRGDLSRACSTRRRAEAPARTTLLALCREGAGDTPRSDGRGSGGHLPRRFVRDATAAPRPAGSEGRRPGDRMRASSGRRSSFCSARIRRDCCCSAEASGGRRCARCAARRLEASGGPPVSEDARMYADRAADAARRVRRRSSPPRRHGRRTRRSRICSRYGVAGDPHALSARASARGLFVDRTVTPLPTPVNPSCSVFTGFRGDAGARLRSARAARLPARRRPAALDGVHDRHARVLRSRSTPSRAHVQVESASLVADDTPARGTQPRLAQAARRRARHSAAPLTCHCSTAIEARASINESKRALTCGRSEGRLQRASPSSFALLAAHRHRRVPEQSIRSTKTSYAVTHTYTVIERIAGVLSELKDAETGQRGFVIMERTPTSSRIAPRLAEIKPRRSCRPAHRRQPSQQRRLAAMSPLIDAKFAELKRTIDLRRTRASTRRRRSSRATTARRTWTRSASSSTEADQERRTCSRSAPPRSQVERGPASDHPVGQSSPALVLVGLDRLVHRRQLARARSARRSQHVQSSSSRAAGGGQPAGDRREEQATAMTEITTTISELLATSRQIAESAQRVAQIAEQTAGRGALRRRHRRSRRTSRSAASAARSISIVNHMLELGQEVAADRRACSTSSRSWRSRPTSSRSTPPSRRPARARRASASPWSPTRSASSPTASAARPRRSAA